ncbi:MAG TPA: serine/threonine-protein kinase, partial [Acidimicrobiales bacterium]|nr:serine/threonine-protein kinase [Acidimicrobiales bacterium]
MPTGATAGRWIVERYELLGEVSRGPADVVWHGRDRPLDRGVTVREVLLPDVLDDAEQAALAAKVLREARAAAHLSHPAAVAVLDAVVDDDRPFVVTELVDAPTLEDVVAAEGPLAPERAATIGVAVLDALGAAHAGGLVHRDVRPSNVLLPASGDARLTAFGLGALVDDPKVVTSGAGPAPLYLAPEQTGTAGASAASDLWSLGATLYFAVEGVPPFEGEEPAEMLDAIVGREPRPPQRTGPLQAVLDVLLVKDPADRADEAAVRPLLLAAAGPDAPPEPERLPDVAPSANGAAANLSTSTATNGAEPATNGAEPAANGSDPAATSAIATLVTGP